MSKIKIAIQILVVSKFIQLYTRLYIVHDNFSKNFSPKYDEHLQLMCNFF